MDKTLPSEKMSEKTFRPMLTYSDECHHAGAQTAVDVLNEINAKYVYGLTATPNVMMDRIRRYCK